MVVSLAALLSDKLKQRSNGFQLLRQLLANQDNTKQLHDKSYSLLLHALYQAVIRDRKLYMQNVATASSKNGQTAVQLRLSEASDLIRKLVEVGLSDFKIKTVRLLIDHLRECLPLHGTDSYCAPLLNSYSKVCLAISGSIAHLEHLSTQDWSQLMLFACNSVRSIIASSVDANEQDQGPGQGIVRPKRLSAQAVEFHDCISQLLSIEPVINYSILEEVYQHLHYFWMCFSEETAGHVYVLKSLNRLLRYVLVENTIFSQEVCSQGLRLLPNLIGCKDVELKEQIVIFLQLVYNPISLLVSTSNPETLKEVQGDIISVLRPLLYEYTANLALYSPKIEDVVFENSIKPSWFVWPWFRMRSKSSSLSWLSLVAMYKLFLLISVVSSSGE